MHRRSAASVIFAVLVACGALSACSESPSLTDGGGADLSAAADTDMGASFGAKDLAGSDLLGPVTDLLADPCANLGAGCQSFGFGGFGGLGADAAFPLRSALDPNERDNGGVGLDPNGSLGLDSGPHSTGNAWVSNVADWGRGTVSRLNGRTMREIGRYFSVTCGSPSAGTNVACKDGCCAADDLPRYEARVQKLAEPPRQAVQLMNNVPGRIVADDYCCGSPGIALVLNRAPSGQASLTVIAPDQDGCVDRNGDRHIDTSSDVNGDGLIETDCNADSAPDDRAGVAKLPCKNGLAQEFWGLDDECVVLTTNIGAPMQDAHALSEYFSNKGLSIGALAGTASDGRGFFVDVDSGLITADLTLPRGCGFDHAIADAYGYFWSKAAGGGLCVMDTKGNATAIRDMVNGPGAIKGAGLTIDRDQNLWLTDEQTGDAFRYAPDWSGGWKTLGAGFWTWVKGPGSKGGATGGGVALIADSRNANNYFVWQTNADAVIRIPGSSIVRAKMDQTVDGSAYPVVQLPAFGGKDIDLDVNQNLFLVGGAPSEAVRILVDKNGVTTNPDLLSPAKPNMVCPAGDVCALENPNQGDPGSSAATAAWECRSYCRPYGDWSYVVRGCANGGKATDWIRANIDATIPANTTLGVMFRTGPTPAPDADWGPWSTSVSADTAPIDLSELGTLAPPVAPPDGYLQIDFRFSTKLINASPKLNAFNIEFRCSR